jgi:glycosyltransferase involved in cell wall biosynthesis
VSESPRDEPARNLAVPRVAIVASHPIQYQAPWFRALASSPGIEVEVLFVQQPDAQEQGRGFGVAFQWDIPLLEGYPWQMVPKLRGKGGLSGFFSARIAHPLKVLRAMRPDVLLLTGWHVWPLVQMLVAAWWAGIPVIMRGESNALRTRPWLTRAWHKVLLRGCAAFLPIGLTSRAFYARYRIASDKLFDTPYFVDNSRFARSAAEALPRREELRARWSIPAGAVCYCYAGKLESKKRILDLLEALRIAVVQSQRLHLLVVGSGELMDQARAAAAKHNLPVTFAGFLNQSEIPAAYVAADCLVLASDYGETWGLVVNEAMACGRPAIVSDRVGCAADLITPGVTGDIFPFGDCGALAQKLIDLAANPLRLREMGEQARSRVTQHYGVPQSVAGTLAAVQYVLAKS